ncbi:PE family protein [Mycobacterium asiaticum]|uniref:PE domain-containing protein n=1 Tax=Mycobacterium asiaticum TaxID=1790 RepID=A0A1A3CVK2_MYCAS|nr:PE family protein [Mycobacterium asiaticum]OBI90849.1 hypothetical protein A9X01_11000 [Mycobacterium asiaticum]
MSFFNAVPDAMGMAAVELAGINSVIQTANAAAALPTTAIPAPAQDQVSAAVAALYSKYARGYQALGTQVAAFHDQFVRALSSSAGTYALGEAANAAAMQSPLPHLIQPVDAPAHPADRRPVFGTESAAESEHGGWVAPSEGTGGSAASADAGTTGAAGMAAPGGNASVGAAGSGGVSAIGGVGAGSFWRDAGHQGGGLFAVWGSGGSPTDGADRHGVESGGLLSRLLLPGDAESPGSAAAEPKDGRNPAAAARCAFRITRSWPDRWLSNALRRNGAGGATLRTARPTAQASAQIASPS